MISETKVYRCLRCGSSNIVRNGHNSVGSPKYLCKDCKASRALKPKVRYTPEQRAQILRVYQERHSLRALQRLFGVSRPTVIRWVRESRQEVTRGESALSLKI